MKDDNKIIKLALFKACKCLREAIGVNKIDMPWLSEYPDDIDPDGILWMQYFLDEANKELKLNED